MATIQVISRFTNTLIFALDLGHRIVLCLWIRIRIRVTMAIFYL
jgi:hypothetical protein